MQRLRTTSRWACALAGLIVIIPSAAPAGDLFTADAAGDRVLRFAADGSPLGAFVATGSGGLDGPQALTFGPDGNLYVVGAFGVLRYDGQSGDFLDLFVPQGSGGLVAPRGLAFGADGNLYVGSTNGSLTVGSILRYDGMTGAFLDPFVAPGTAGLAHPRDVAFGPDGSLYVTDFKSTSVRRFSGSDGSSQGVFVDSFDADVRPARLLFRPDGKQAYVAMGNAAEVRRYDARSGAFQATLEVGSGFGDLMGLAWGADGNLYVSDFSAAGYRSILRFSGANDAFLDTFVPTGTNGFTGSPGITFACQTGGPILCLGDGARYRVTAHWSTVGASGLGHAIQVTPDTGYFWFFNADNVEVVVKVRNGCPVNDRTWVFAGGLTNQEVTLTVEDTETGETVSYQNPTLTPFQPITDTSAFANCP